MRVLITRPEHDTEPLRAMLEERGFAVMVMPTIAVRPVEDNTGLVEALSQLHSFDWIVFTSRNAVDAVTSAIEVLGRDFAPGPLVAAVGERTAEVLRLAGITVACVPPEATAESLAHTLIQRGVRGSHMLLPLGDRARPQLAELLREAGADVREVIVYRTVNAAPEGVQSGREALRGGLIDAVALASPSAFDGLLTLLGPDAPVLRAVRLVCIGPTTAAAVRDAGFTPAAIANPHTLEGLAEALSTVQTMETSHDSI